MMFGNMLRSLRNEKRLTMRQVAQLAGVSPGEISRVETGVRQKPSPLFLRAVAPVLDVSIEQLMMDAGYIDATVPPQVGKAPESDPGMPEVAALDDELMELMARAAEALITEDLQTLKVAIKMYLERNSLEAIALVTIANKLCKA